MDVTRTVRVHTFLPALRKVTTRLSQQRHHIGTVEEAGAYVQGNL